MQQTHFPPKVYKLSKAKFSHFDRTRRDKNQIFRTQVTEFKEAFKKIPNGDGMINFEEFLEMMVQEKG